MASIRKIKKNRFDLNDVFDVYRKADGTTTEVEGPNNTTRTIFLPGSNSEVTQDELTRLITSLKENQSDDSFDSGATHFGRHPFPGLFQHSHRAIAKFLLENFNTLNHDDDVILLDELFFTAAIDDHPWELSSDNLDT